MDAGFLEPKRMRPGSAAVVVLLHGAAITALLLAKTESVPRETFTPIDTYGVPVPPPPPPEPVRDPPQRREQTVWTPTPTPPFRTPTDLTVPERPPVPVPDPGALAGNDDVPAVPEPRRDPIPDPPAPPAPVRIEPRMISGDLQPPYPASEQRLEHEGTVVIRVTIGPNGRVIAAQKVRATSDAFYEATERHARARWRFRPATIDGRPVEGTKLLTVHFRLDEA